MEMGLVTLSPTTVVVAGGVKAPRLILVVEVPTTTHHLVVEAMMIMDVIGVVHLTTGLVNAPKKEAKVQECTKAKAKEKVKEKEKEKDNTRVP